MSRRLAVLAAMLLCCASVSAHAAPDPTAADRKEFHEALIANPTMRDLMEIDPEGFKAFEEGLLVDLAAGKVDESGARKRGYEFAVATRAKLASALTKAPDDEYVAFVDAQLAAMKTLGRYNPKACYELVENGAITEETSRTLGPDLAAELVKVGHAQVVAARAGAKTPVTRPPSTEKEIDAVIQNYVDREGDMAWLQAMGDKSTDKLTPEKRCESATRWIEAILAQPKATAARLLTEQ